MTPGTRARSWLGVALLAGVAACALAWAGGLPPAPWAAAWLDWQPALWWRQPWRLFSAALLHWSTLHLVANLAGCALLAALGQVARLPARSALAWLLAWPLTQLGLLAQPELLHYAGLSGLLHAGVAVAVVELLRRPPGREPLIGALLGLGLLAKLVLEQPWGAPLRLVSGWDIALAPAAHLSGTLAGAACAWLLRRPGARGRPGAA